MLRLIPLVSALAATAACGGCITPATVAPVESDALPLAIVAAEPREKPPAPLAKVAATQVRSPLQPIAPPPPPADPPQPKAPEDLPPNPAAATQIKSIQQISLDISLPDKGDLIPPPVNIAATALPQLASQQPFYRGDLLDYGLSDNNAPVPVSLDLCYQPLYFQELNAERYGRSWGILQPAVSVANFYGRIPLLPYMAFARPARRCTFHAHWAMPGYRIPEREPHDLVVSPAGGAAQTAALIGVILLVP